MYVKFDGRLGNQLFQYAFYLWLKNEFPVNSIKVDLSSYKNYENGEELFEIEKLFDVLLDKCSKQESDTYNVRKKIMPVKIANIFKISAYINGKNVITENNLNSHMITEKSYFRGYWQSEKYFQNISLYIKSFYTEVMNNKIIDVKNLEILERIKNTFSVSIHVRRGDYLYGNNSSYFVNLSQSDYYTQSISYIKTLNTNPVFFVFSDDIDWCRQYFIGDEYYFVDINNEKDTWKDIVLMSNCKANIVANSSFSWWGAYLGDESIVIAPANIGKDFEKSHPDYFPSSWIRI